MRTQETNGEASTSVTVSNHCCYMAMSEEEGEGMKMTWGAQLRLSPQDILYYDVLGEKKGNSYQIQY